MKTQQEIRIEALEKTLKALTGKAVFLKDKMITIRSFKIFTNAVTIITDEAPLYLELHLVQKFIEELSGEIPVNFSPIDTSLLIDDDEKPAKHKFMEITPEQLKINDLMETKRNTEEAETTKENAVATTTTTEEPIGIEVSNYRPNKENIIIKDALMDMLKKVSQSQHAIPQAKAVCDIANTMVNIQKNEIQLIQMANKLK
ncbi:hypothetical protein QLS91_08075 [Flavobacterium sp. LB2P84]|uniref:hypothetical protein n=1 Tax=Flavobacterium yafengii TaxID=3041253 RepID=UPI0024A90AB7|nr:hypothetical protein [Flavobacterium yafengii]MDI6033029.1 hypothetical protein [Flavobacterium yafengii]